MSDGRLPVSLDHNATTPLLPGVVAAMLPHLREHSGSPSKENVSSVRLSLRIDRSGETGYFSRIRHALLHRTFLALFLLVPATVLASGTAPAPCEMSCPEDDEAGECGDDCSACVCCAPAQCVPAVPSNHVEPPYIEEWRESSTSAVMARQPDDVFHVPKRPL